MTEPGKGLQTLPHHLNEVLTMKDSLSFSYKSIGNFMKLLATIRFEQTEPKEEIAIWHGRFDNDEADELFENFLIELFPNGKTIQPEDVDTVVFRAKKFLETDEKVKEIRNASIRRRFDNWVYFKPTNTVYACEFAEHAETIRKICTDFFKGFDELDVDYLKRFILSNFEIKSDNSTVESISKDAEFIHNMILFSYRGDKRR